ncbi:hypothetical protein Ancab_009034 [Ancistrocladus abbreviatus]
MEENSSEEVLFETRRHASRPYSTNYPPQQLNEGARSGVLSSILTRGFTQLKEKWSGYNYNQPKNFRRWVSLFVSPKGEWVAVAVGNHITILRKDDNYQEPYGMFTGGSVGTFVHGAWSETHDVLGVIDDCDSLYFVKANGEVIIKIERRHLKVSWPIIGLLVPEDIEKKDSFLCSFHFLSSDGSLQRIEVSQDLNASLSSIRTCTNINKQFLHNVSCLDYGQKHSLLALVGGAGGMSQTASSGSGSCSLSVWRWSQSSDLGAGVSIQFNGVYSKPKGYMGLVTSPKVLISPKANFIATLDLTGCLNVFKLEGDCCSISSFSCGDRGYSGMTNKSAIGREFLVDIIDFTWWSDHILTLARRSGVVTMFNIISGKKVLENDPVFSMPIIERIQWIEGEVFLLDSTSSEGREVSRVYMEIAGEGDMSHLKWSLVSFSERSISEMYDALIDNKNYQSALDFADRHKLDKDQVLKSQWLHSEHGSKEINMFLSNIKDEGFILSECVGRVGPTEDAVKALLAFGLRLTDHYKFSDSEVTSAEQIWNFRLLRLQMLQFKDRLETFLGINMGRFSMQEYSKFRGMPISQAALRLAENGKIGTLNLLFKRHPYSLSSHMLEVFSAIPETVPVQTYGQLLPGRSPPPNTALRDQDWVECEKMVTFVGSLPENYESGMSIRTETIIKQMLGFSWPPTNEIAEWYKNRAREIDRFSGQLENSLCLVDLGCRKGIYELQQFYEDISYLQWLIFSETSDDKIDFSMSLDEWECLSDYEKFRAMLKGVKEENVVERLHDKAILFMHSRCHHMTTSLEVEYQNSDSFLVRWMKEIAMHNDIEKCLVIIEEARKDWNVGFFANEMEAIDCALQCIYLCNVTDKWNTMASIMSKFAHIRGTDQLRGLEGRLKLAEGHIEAGRLLALYQVPKPMSFFLESTNDEKSVKQILRLILSKFIRQQAGRSDNDWANMWHDLQCLQEKAFPFLDLEYLLIEFCRGLLKAGKFSLARNYLKGTGSVNLPAEKVENLVIQTAREYFFSASSLDSSDIWKAKECLDLFPSSRAVRAEADIIDALTVKLPNLGVHLLPLQYKQIKDPMEIIKMAVTCQAGGYVNVDEIIEVAKFFGLNSPEDVSAVQEAIAREAAVAGDLQLAFDLCLVLARRGHGLVWDLCAAIARGPAIENMDISSRKQLLGFALSHCDDESIGELLHAGKDLDLQSQSESLMILTGTSPPNFTVEGSSVISLPGQHIVSLKDCSGLADGVPEDDFETHLRKIKAKLSEVARDLPIENGTSWDDLLRENGKLLSFAALQLPWLVELSGKSELGKTFYCSSVGLKHCLSARMQSIVAILCWLARCGFPPKDDLIISLAKSLMEPPVSEEEDIMACSFLLNLIDAFHGVELIEEQLKSRRNYQEICSIMYMGMTYSLLHNSELQHKKPLQRRELLLRRFREKISSNELDKIDKEQSTFWIEWKLKLEEQKRVADHVQVLEQLIPGVETSRFLSGDSNYIRSVIFSFVESVKLEKKHILKDVLKLADTYSLNRSEVLLKFLSSVLVSEAWTTDEITAEISEVKSEILAFASETIKTITCVVYPVVDGCNKTRLAYIYKLLSNCYVQLQENTESKPSIYPDTASLSGGLAHFYQVLEQACNLVSFIQTLNFKNIADIGGLKYKHISREICDHIDESSVEALAKMVETLIKTCSDPVTEDLMTWQDVHRFHVLTLFSNLKSRASHIKNPESLQGLLTELEQTYDISRKHIRVLEARDALDILKQYFKGIIPLYIPSGSVSNEATWKDCLIVLFNFWIRLTEDMQEIDSEEKRGTDCLMMCLKVFLRFVMEEKVTPRQGWGVVYGYAHNGLLGSPAAEIFYFCRAMVLSGCRFCATAVVFSEAMSHCAVDQTLRIDSNVELSSFQDVSSLYSNILGSLLQGLIHENSECHNLLNLLSSLSSSEGRSEDLNRVRHSVWERLAMFSNNLQLPSHLRVYILEIMQSILGRNLKGSPEQGYDFLPWEGWDEWHYASNDSEASYDRELPRQSDASSRFKNTLVALKSTELASTISPSIVITPDDLLTLESAVSCFVKLCEAATMDSHFDALLAIVGEWESLFVMDITEEAPAQAPGAGAIWSSDWDDDGWENFEPVEKGKKECPVSIHPLHACWMAIMRRLTVLSQFSDILKLIDRSLGNSNVVLIDEDEARKLSETIVISDCFVALKIVLLLPYEAIQLKCLDALEDKLKQGGITDSNANDHEVLILVLSSGVISNIISKSSYHASFSYLCFLVGNFSRLCQDAQLEKLNEGEKYAHDGTKEKIYLLFRNVLFPCFVSELVKADQQILAGFLVTKFMHTNAALSLINVAEASLNRYLKMQLQAFEAESSAAEEEAKASELLGNTLSCLKVKLKTLVQSALSSLPSRHN